MPITLAHPAAVVALRGTGLPMTGLVVGSMVPDLPIFLAGAHRTPLTHSWWSFFTVDTVIAVALCWVWFGWLRAALVDMSPAPVRARLPADRPVRGRERLLIPVAAALGAGTHLLWDSFTHADHWGVRRVGWLQQQHSVAGHSDWGFQWAQFGTGLLGMVVVAVVGVRWLIGREPIREVPPHRLGPVVQAMVLTSSLAVGVVGVVAGRGSGWETMALNGVVWSLSVAAVGGVLAAALWPVLRGRWSGRADDAVP